MQAILHRRHRVMHRVKEQRYMRNADPGILRPHISVKKDPTISWDFGAILLTFFLTMS